MLGSRFGRSLRLYEEPASAMNEVDQRYNEAEKLKDSGKREEAVAILQGILETHPDHVLTHLTLARLMTQMGNHDEAIRHGLKACELEPEEAFNYTAMSVTYQRAFAGTGERRYIQLAEDAMARAHSLG